ncbi:hypothetical protein [Streptomyces sp. TRM49041]|uniref:hypothetical protein n=1 Tax=Streptomyces sp. TRM49041 TaxID=2603216 RepID=UPI0021CCFF94|nr:hypothetical protein [Streptomyces sp. TRM49041]
MSVPEGEGTVTVAGTEFCVYCDKPITGGAKVIEGFSASGARPDSYYHPMCGPRQAPYGRGHQVGPYGDR